MGGSASALNLADIKFTENECKHAIKELFQAKTFENLADADNTVSLGALHGHLKEKTDCFLTHDWGTDLGMDNHARVSRVNDALKKRGLRTWFDGEKMEGNVKKKMISGIDHTYCVVVFVTKRYMDKVDSDNAEDNCQLEFNYASRRHTGKKMVPVVMEARMQATNDWIGEVGMVLGGSLYVNLSAEDSFEVRMDELYSRILGVTGTTIQKVMDSPVWGELISQKAQSAPAAPVVHVEPTTPAAVANMEPTTPASAANVASTTPIAAANVAPKTPAATVSDSDPLVAELKAWICKHTKIVQVVSNKIALLLVGNGVGSVDKLRKKLIKNANFLSDMDIDEDDAEELVMAVLGQKETTPTVPDKPAEKEFKVGSLMSSFLSDRSMQDLYDAFVSAWVLGNEGGKELLEVASTSSDQDRAMVAKMFVMFALRDGGGTITKDRLKSKAYAKEVLPWMQEHSLPPRDLLVAPGDVYQKPFAMSTIVTAMLAWMLQYGIVCKKDHSKAVRCLKAAVPHGNSVAQFEFGNANAMGMGIPVNKEQGVQYYRLAAEQGNPLAVLTLGLSYRDGDGVQKDLEEACRFFKMAADLGYARGMYELGSMYYNGEGVAMDYKEAVRLFQLAAEKVDVKSFVGLAKCCFYGKGVDADLESAKGFATMAANAGDKEAKALLEMM